MNSNPWWDHFDEDPYEKIGRFVPDAFGHPIQVALARISWAYLDWLDEEYGSDDGEFFITNYRIYNPHECDFSEWMEGAVSGVFLRMEKKGRPRPSWCPPAPPWQMVDI